MGRDELLKLLPIPGLGGYLEIIDGNIESWGTKSVFKNQISELSARRGKRLRPILLIAAAQLGGRKIDKRIIDTATALELIHEASLVHDDVIDGDSHFEPAEALLLGDFLIAAGLGLAGSLDTAACQILSSAVKDMANGQAMQMMPRYKADVSDSFYLKTVKNKTAALFEAACRLGGGEQPAAQPMRRFGAAFGIAFQIIDDIADQDFKPKEAAGARKLAQAHCRAAAKAISGLGPSRLKSSLMEIPQLYLELSLP